MSGISYFFAITFFTIILTKSKKVSIFFNFGRRGLEMALKNFIFLHVLAKLVKCLALAIGEGREMQNRDFCHL